MTQEEKDARVQPPTTLPTGEWILILGGAEIDTEDDTICCEGTTKIKPGATVHDVLTNMSKLSADIDAHASCEGESCFVEIFFFEGFIEECPGVYRVFLT